MSQINSEKWGHHRHVANYNYYIHFICTSVRARVFFWVIGEGYWYRFPGLFCGLCFFSHLESYSQAISLLPLPWLFFEHTAWPLMHACTCLVTQMCLTLCDPVGCSLPVSSVHGILQARILKSVPYPFYKGSSQLRDQTWVSCITGRFFTIWAIRDALVPQFKIQYLSFYRHHKYLFIITKYKSIKLRKHIWFWHFNFNTTSFLFLLYLSKWDTLPKTKCSKYEFIVIVFDIWVP